MVINNYSSFKISKLFSKRTNETHLGLCELAEFLLKIHQDCREEKITIVHVHIACTTHIYMSCLFFKFPF
uniref:Uncharacterized protein n=1 Tax=Arundo donax TaxID=35708 RepID=A0A0A9CC45_ARUDO